MMRLRLLLIVPLLFIGIAVMPPKTARGLGMETFGNKEIKFGNYDAWPGILPVINNKHRVYHWWVNGNEKFFYKGDTADLNALLLQFAKIKVDVKEVVIRPTIGETKSMMRDKTIQFNWDMQIIGGIAAGMLREDMGEKIWVTHPVLTVHVGNAISLDKLVIPEAVKVTQIGELQARYAEAFESTSRTVRGWACGHIARLDPYNSAAMYRVAKMLTDEDDWIRLNATGAIGGFAAKAKPALKQLRTAAVSDNEKLSKRATETIKLIEAAELDPAAEAKHVATVQAIAEFCAAL